MENEIKTGSEMNQQMSQETEVKNSQVANNQVAPSSASRKSNFFTKYHSVIKLVIITVISFLLLIPGAFIQNLVDERNITMNEVGSDIKEKWGVPNTIAGPYINLMSMDISENTAVSNNVAGNCCYILPETLDISGNINTEMLHRGIYEIPAYKVPLEISGEFVLPKEFDSKRDKQWNFEKAYVQFDVSSLRNVSDNVVINIGGQDFSMSPSNSDVLACELDLLRLLEGDSVKFSMKLSLKGTDNLMFKPLGRTTNVHLTSDYTTPSFNGYYLPDNREVASNGFSASWKVLSINRDYPQVLDTKYSMSDDSLFGVELIVPVEQYQQTTRAIKYSLLIIMLTFATVFFFETRKAKPIHPVQYLLIGIALIVFYTLLLSFSEHISFWLSYLISAVMTVGLIVAFIATILKDFKTTLGLGALLTLLYSFIYVLLQLESYALLVGSIGVFIILGVAMFGSRKIDWYKKRV